jgi:hypothetical protein
MSSSTEFTTNVVPNLILRDELIPSVMCLELNVPVPYI